jgi:hypothetical protein
MQPYQEASGEIQRQQRIPGNIARGAVSAVGTGAAASLFGRVMPFLSSYIPQDLAIKGLNKVNPTIGNFVQTALGQGYAYDEVKEFLKDKFENKEPAKQSKNIIEQLSPELHQFIDQEVRNGRKPIEAGALAQNDKRFKDIINKLTKEHKTPWSNILESVYGGEGMAPIQSQSQAALQPEQMQQQQMQQGQQQPGPGQSKLMAVLQELQKSRGAQ